MARTCMARMASCVLCMLLIFMYMYFYIWHLYRRSVEGYRIRTRVSLTCSRSWRSGYQHCVHMFHWHRSSILISLFSQLVSRLFVLDNTSSLSSLHINMSCACLLTHAHFRTFHMCVHDGMTELAKINSLLLLLPFYLAFVIGTG